MSKKIAPAVIALAAAFLACGAGPAAACVGRTLFVGHHDAPDQVMVAHLLAAFIDERTGTTVKLTRFAGREEAIEAIRQDKVSLYSDHSGILLRKFAGEAPGADEEKNLARLKEVLNRKYNIVWLEPVGYDRSFSDRTAAGERPGKAGILLCKDALAKFPALPKLLGKLRGVLDNETMATLLREAAASDPRTVARKFLKGRKLI